MTTSAATAEAEACIKRGDVLEETGDLAGAALEFVRASQLAPSDTEAWSSLGNVLKGLARPAEAAVAYERAAASDPTDPDLLLYRAAALSRCGDLEEAARCIDAAMELLLAAAARDADAVADGWGSRGVAAFGLGRTTEAVSCYDRALAEVPGHTCAASNRRHATARLFWEGASSPPDNLPPSCAVLLQPFRSLELPGTRCGLGFARNPLWRAHVMPALDAEACAALVSASERHVATCGGWSSSRHLDSFPTRDFEASDAPELQSLLLPLCRTVLLPTLASLFLRGAAAGARPVLRELFVVRYAAGGGGSPGLAPHRDGHPLSFSLLLSDPGDFEGGGTELQTLGTTLRPRQGEVLMHSGSMLHAGSPVSRGVRYLLVGFVEAVGPDGAPSRSPAQRAARADEDAVGGRTDYERLADDWAAFVAAAEAAVAADSTACSSEVSTPDCE